MTQTSTSKATKRDRDNNSLYRLAPVGDLNWNMWVEYREIGRNNMKRCVVNSDFSKYICSKCDRVNPKYIPSLREVEVQGYRDRYHLVQYTSDGYLVCNLEFWEIINGLKIPGLKFIPINSHDGSFVIISTKILKCNTDRITFNDPCEKCGRPISSFGIIEKTEKPTTDSIYKLSFSYETGYAMKNIVVFNENVAALLEHHGASGVVQKLRNFKAFIA